ncbi:MAG TPA: hypothetical protein VMY77_11715 [Chitinophagaceae bacterium]|nr:hypothetical protein [Chitinophagaceae bacterium]
MNINRNNYEEYFLLYADKELSADEKSLVEMFVQQNPDLEEEFVMLQQSVVKPDNTITLDKSSLFRKEVLRQAQYINQDNYEEKFLLYTDNEMSLSEIEETEKFVLSNPSLQTEFTLLQQVKYEPDTSIVFPDKRLLYKNEDEGKVIPFNWRYLAAAILLGIGLWTGINYLPVRTGHPGGQKDKTEPGIVSRPATETKIVLPVKPVEQKDVEKSLVKTDQAQKEPVQAIEKKQMDTRVTKLQQDVAVKQDKAVKNIQQVIIPGTTKLPEQKKEVIVKNDLPVKSNELPQQIRTTDNITSQSTGKTITTSPAVQSNYAMPASYIAEEEVKSENYVFYNITTEEFRKSKVGNFLKKVKRAVERKIPFKNGGLKIGTVEIAKDIQN